MPDLFGRRLFGRSAASLRENPLPLIAPSGTTLILLQFTQSLQTLGLEEGEIPVLTEGPMISCSLPRYRALSDLEGLVQSQVLSIDDVGGGWRSMPAGELGLDNWPLEPLDLLACAADRGCYSAQLNRCQRPCESEGSVLKPALVEAPILPQGCGRYELGCVDGDVYGPEEQCAEGAFDFVPRGGCEPLIPQCALQQWRDQPGVCHVRAGATGSGTFDAPYGSLEEARRPECAQGVVLHGAVEAERATWDRQMPEAILGCPDVSALTLREPLALRGESLLIQGVQIHGGVLGLYQGEAQLEGVKLNDVRVQVREASLRGTRVVFEGPSAGVSALVNAEVDLERVGFAGCSEHGYCVNAVGGRVRLEDFAMVGTSTNASIRGVSTAHLHLQRGLIEEGRARGIEVLEDTAGNAPTLEASDLVVRNTAASGDRGVYGEGLFAQGVADLMLRRVVIFNVQRIGLFALGGANVDFEDIVVRDVRFQRLGSNGIQLERKPEHRGVPERVRVNRAQIEGVTSEGLLCVECIASAQPDERARFENIVVNSRGTVTDSTGQGIRLNEGSAHLLRARVTGAIMNGIGVRPNGGTQLVESVLVEGADNGITIGRETMMPCSVTLSNIEVRQPKERGLVFQSGQAQVDNLKIEGGRVGIDVQPSFGCQGLSVERFSIEGAEIGVEIGQGANDGIGYSLSDGEIIGNEAGRGIGISISRCVPGRLEALTDRVLLQSLHRVFAVEGE